MYLLTYHVQPNPHNPEHEEIGGAYVNCYIEADTFEEADFIAKGDLEKNQWRILELDDARIVSREDYADEDEDLEFYQQALIDKEVFVFHMYPIEE